MRNTRPEIKEKEIKLFDISSAKESPSSNKKVEQVIIN